MFYDWPRGDRLPCQSAFGGNRDGDKGRLADIASNLTFIFRAVAGIADQQLSRSTAAYLYLIVDRRRMDAFRIPPRNGTMRSVEELSHEKDFQG